MNLNNFSKLLKNNKLVINSIFNSPFKQQQQQPFSLIFKQYKTNFNNICLPIPQSLSIRSFTNSYSNTNLNKNKELKITNNNNKKKTSIFKFNIEEWSEDKKQQYFKSSNKANIVYIIIGANVLTWLYMNSDDSFNFQRYISKNFMLSVDNFEQLPHTLLTSMFAHKDANHLIFNMLALFSLGPYLMNAIGASSFFALYMGSGVASGLGFLALQKYYNKGKSYYQQRQQNNIKALGASGAVSGILMVFACLFPKMQLSLYGILPIPSAILVSAYFAYDLYNEVYRKQTGICHVGHLMGGVYGLISYLLLFRGRY